MDDEMEKNKQKIIVKLEEQVRVCNICNKEFSNGKALGGHMRVHVQENKLDLSKKQNKKAHISVEKSQNLVSLSENEKASCNLCFKEFPSIKSLCGHMRCHPERDYRGIVPPKNDFNIFCSSSSLSYEKISCEKDEMDMTMPSWNAKAKRGRRSPKLLEFDDDFDEEDKQAVYDLMSLTQGEFFDIEGESMNKSRVLEGKKRRIGDLGYGNKCSQLRINETVTYEGKGKGKVWFDGNENGFFSDDEFVCGDSENGSVFSDELVKNMKLSKKASGKKKPKFMDLKSVEEGDIDEDMDYDDVKVVEKGALVKYKCDTCHKSFPSHQALGGHRSSHNRAKYSSSTLDSEIVFGSPHKSQGDNTYTIDSSVHQCKTCDKVFPTGQALGGHQRTHWVGPADGQGSSHGTSSPGEEASRTRVLVIDLNEPPPSEEDGGVESQNHAGYASTSHNSDV